MIDAIKNDRQPYVDAYAGRSALELVLAIYKSQKEGRVVKLPLKDFSSVDMVGEFFCKYASRVSDNVNPVSLDDIYAENLSM